MKAEQFEIVDEPHSDDGTEKLDGCGFIPDCMLLELVEKMGKASGGLAALRAIIKEEGFKGKVRWTGMHAHMHICTHTYTYTCDARTRYQCVRCTYTYTW